MRPRPASKSQGRPHITKSKRVAARTADEQRKARAKERRKALRPVD